VEKSIFKIGKKNTIENDLLIGLRLLGQSRRNAQVTSGFSLRKLFSGPHLWLSVPSLRPQISIWANVYALLGWKLDFMYCAFAISNNILVWLRP